MNPGHLLHARWVHPRRISVITNLLSNLVEPNTSLLDVGTGDGKLAATLAEKSKLDQVKGVDVLLRDQTSIPVSLFDGGTLPFPDKSFDYVLFVDVLHHTETAGSLLKEASRVARKRVLIKDHLSENAVDFAILSFMDDFGNKQHGVKVPNLYLNRREWNEKWAQAGLKLEDFESKVPLYPFPFSLVFGRNLHFVAALSPL